MNRREYNGWTNYETWLVNLWYGDIFSDTAGEYQLDPQSMRDFVEEMLETDGQLPETGFAADIMNAALREVDWQQIAEHYLPEEEEEDA